MDLHKLRTFRVSDCRRDQSDSGTDCDFEHRWFKDQPPFQPHLAQRALALARGAEVPGDG
jgi:hypothetical protein